MKHLNKFKTFENEKYILDDILSINEGVSSIIDKVKKYASKGLLSAALVATLLSSPNVSAQDKEKIKEITKTETAAPTYAEKRAADAEKRADALIKRTKSRNLMNDRFIKSAIIAGWGEPMTDEEFSSALEKDDKTISDIEKDICYKEIDGNKYKVNLKKFRKFKNKQGRQENIPQEGLQDPSFTSTSCGISKQHARDDKKEWSKK
jgi:hypothetical protein